MFGALLGAAVSSKPKPYGSRKRLGNQQEKCLRGEGSGFLLMEIIRWLRLNEERRNARYDGIMSFTKGRYARCLPKLIMSKFALINSLRVLGRELTSGVT